MKKQKKLSSNITRRIKRKYRIRNKISGTAERPRLSIFKSLKYLYAQVIDDNTQKSLAFVSTNTKDFRAKHKSCKNIAAAQDLGKAMGEKIKELKIESVVFDRNGNRYHGKLKAFADAVREAGVRI